MTRLRSSFVATLLTTVSLFNLSLSFTAMQSPNIAVVTGASGFLGREIVKELLADEDTSNREIICLVRESRLADEEKYWANIQKDDGDLRCDLRVLPYDMIDGGTSLSNALESIFTRHSSCDPECCIYHVASIFSPTENHKQMALDNVKGAEDLMNVVATFSKNIKVIFTSSMAAVRGSGQVPKNEKFYTHEDYNILSELGKNWGSSYQWSKAESEKKSWEIAKENNIPFVSLCPSFIFGPPTDPKTSNSFSLSIVSSWIRGESPVQSRLCVDVRDVAKAHVIAGKSKGAVNERIIVSTEARLPSTMMAAELKRISTEIGVGDAEKIHADTEFDGGIIPIGSQEVECVDRLKLFLDGLEPRSVKETMADMAEALLNDNLCLGETK